MFKLKTVVAGQDIYYHEEQSVYLVHQLPTSIQPIECYIYFIHVDTTLEVLKTSQDVTDGTSKALVKCYTVPEVETLVLIEQYLTGTQVFNLEASKEYARIKEGYAGYEGLIDIAKDFQ